MRPAQHCCQFVFRSCNLVGKLLSLLCCRQPTKRFRPQRKRREKRSCSTLDKHIVAHVERVCRHRRARRLIRSGKDAIFNQTFSKSFSPQQYRVARARVLGPRRSITFPISAMCLFSMVVRRFRSFREPPLIRRRRTG